MIHVSFSGLFADIYSIIAGTREAAQSELLDRFCAKNARIRMVRHLPPLNALRAFEAAGRHQSFSAAAAELGVSHSAISRHVRGLEARLEVKLFRTESRGVVLTHDGARYLSEVTPIFDAIAQATEEVSGRISGAVVLSCEPVFALKWLVPRLTAFHEAHPEIELQLDATEHVIDIAQYEAELAIRFYSDAAPGPVGDLISDAPIYPYVAPSLLTEPLQHPRDLLRFKLLKERRGDISRQWFTLAGVDPSAVPPDGFRMRAVLAMEAAVAGQGVIFASADLAQADVQARRLVRCFDIGLRRGNYQLLTGTGALRRKPVRIFKEWLLQETAPLRGGWDI